MDVLFKIWKVNHYFFPTHGKIHFIHSGFVILIYMFPIAGNYFILISLIRLCQKFHLIWQKPNKMKDK